ncbi:MAG: glycogen debranching protein GlgX [Thermotogae bacterium]|nr:glycogen debranching protein GlgX [Thermotogota bacterium]
MNYMKDNNLRVFKGFPVFGANVDSTGVNFAVFSRNASDVQIELYKNFYDDDPFFVYKLDPLFNKTGDVWHVYIEGAKHGLYYGWRMDGLYDISSGHRFNFKKLLVDPYAKALSSSYEFELPYMYSYSKSDDNSDVNIKSELNSSKSKCKSIIIDDSVYDWENDRNPRTSFNESVIYELHVRLFTVNPNSSIDSSLRGTFRGLANMVEYFKKLGITAVELMPVFEFNMNGNTNVNPLNNEKLREVWGYNPINFFAVTGNYSCGMRLGEQVFEFKDFIKVMHKNNIEVILDVVYNHTGEGNHLGPTVSFRGIDNSVYYLLENDRKYYSNYSGTGNTLNCSHSVVKQMIIDSLRYWVTEMHVDGFRFDLAAILGRDSKGNWIGDLSLLKDIADDPILSGSKLIAEGWDAAGGYYVGEFPTGWAEWNGKFRDTMRKFIRGDDGVVGEVATRIAGSPDIFWKEGSSPYSSVNFITAHDGFTMWDLVSYNEKHNTANGENNRDGSDFNFSFNNGFEGETDNAEIVKLRKRHIKNYFTILMLSQGVPMILMGDEFCRTQLGNNNAYCQDNNISWVDWSRKDKFSDVFDYVIKIIEFRKKHHTLRRVHFFQGKDFTGDGILDITWHGINLFKPDFSSNSHSLAFMISGKDYFGEYKTPDNDIYVAMNMYSQPLEFELPKISNKKWITVFDTYYDNLSNNAVDGGKYKVMEKSIIILISEIITEE